MPLANRDLIDGNSPKILQKRSGKPLRQIPFLNFLDHVPGYRQMCGYILDRHVFRQFQGISLKSTGVRKPGISKSQRHLTNTAATKAAHPLNAEIEEHILETDGNASNRLRAVPRMMISRLLQTGQSKTAPFVAYIGT